jgi:hypothetical protein
MKVIVAEAASIRSPGSRRHLERRAERTRLLTVERGADAHTAARIFSDWLWWTFPAGCWRQRSATVIACGSTAALDGCRIGAVFTPPLQRGKSSPRNSSSTGIGVKGRRAPAGLFSEIGAAFYERLRFIPVQIDGDGSRAPQWCASMLVRAGGDRDLPAVEAMHQVRSSVRFALTRDKSTIHYALKKRLLAGLGPQGLRQVQFIVAEEGVSAVMRPAP